MSEWWTYSLADFLMYTPQTYERLLIDLAVVVPVVVPFLNAVAKGGAVALVIALKDPS